MLHGKHAAGYRVRREPRRSVGADTDWSWLQITATSLVMLTAVVITPLLIGALAVFYGDELHVDATGVGILTSVSWTASALSAATLSGVTDRWGWRRGAAAGLSVTGVCQVSIALFAHSFIHFVIGIGAAGLGYGIVAAASNLVILSGVPKSRRGTALGMKQTAPPLAGLIAGLGAAVLVPVIGWRGAFEAAGTISLLTAVWCMPWRSDGARRQRLARIDGDEAPLGRYALLIAGSAFFATLPVGAFQAYAVLSLTTVGLSVYVASLIFAGASLASLATRVMIGVLADRWRINGFHGAALLIGTGSVGLILMGLPWMQATVIGTTIIFAAGWGWPALMLLGLVSHPRTATGSATGRFHAGTGTGAATGPALFAAAHAVGGMQLAWWLMALLTVPAVVITLAAKRAFQPAEVT